MNTQKRYPRNNLLSLKEMKKRKIDAPIAFMINHLLNFRIFKVTEDLSREESYIDAHWEKLIDVKSGQDLMLWTKELRKIVWGSEDEWDKIAPDLIAEDKIEITKKMVDLLGPIVANIILDNSYWINIWNEVKSYDYFTLELQAAANKTFMEEKFPFNPEINEEMIVERGEYIKDRFGISSFSFAGFFSYSDMFNILLRMEEDFENVTSTLDWEESELGASKLNISFGLSVSPHSEYNSLNKLINLNISGFNNFYEEYFKAIDNEIATVIFDNESDYDNIDAYASKMILNSHYTDAEDFKEVIYSYNTPKLKEYHKQNIKIKLLKMIPKLLDTMITPKTSQEIFKAFIENRKNEYIKFFNKNMKFYTPTKKIKESWEMWKINTANFIHSDIAEIMEENLSIKLYLESILKLIDNIIDEKIKWNKSWIVLLSEMELNMFEAKKDAGIFINSVPFEAKKSSIEALLPKSFSSYIESNCNQNDEIFFMKKTNDNLSYPQGMDKDLENKWWKENMPLFKEYWTS